MNWWNAKNFRHKRPYLERRMHMIKAVRAFFDEQGFMEVETPILQVCPAMDVHLHGFATTLKGVDLKNKKQLYLHTSPEFEMKKLLVAGLPKIYQICHVFRNGEDSKRHSAEFTMIEWYRAKASYKEIMDDCERLLFEVSAALGIDTLRYKKHECDPFAEVERLSVAEAFERYAGINLENCLDNDQLFKELIEEQGMHTAEDDRWDDLFFRVMMEKIEPFLGMGNATILYDYPVSMASLSRKKESDPRFAERFELYVCGIELANAFSELTDPAEQRKRFVEEMDTKEKLYGERYPVDEDFIAAIEHGMPKAGGIALGLDRLAMLCSGAEDIDDVLWCGKV